MIRPQVEKINLSLFYHHLISKTKITKDLASSCHQIIPLRIALLCEWAFLFNLKKNFFERKKGKKRSNIPIMLRIQTALGITGIIKLPLKNSQLNFFKLNIQRYFLTLQFKNIFAVFFLQEEEFLFEV